MCRLLGVVSSHRTVLRDLFGVELDRFVKLARDHTDGWGVAYLTAIDELALVKEPRRLDESAHFDSLIGVQFTDAAILHLRLASPGYPVELGNTHPFCDGRNAFAHNGAFSPSTVLDAGFTLAEVASLEGGTDSERYYLAVRQLIASGEDPGKALIGTAAAIRRRAASFESLNSLLLTPEALYAYADHNPDSKVLGRRGAEFFDLRFRVDPGRVVVGSTGWPQSARRWERLEPRQLLRVDRRDLRVSVIEG
jgi:predicted glutamine amidotransferase